MLIKNKTRFIKILGVTDLTLLAFTSTKDIILTLKTQKSIMAFTNFLGKPFFPMTNIINFSVYAFAILSAVAIMLGRLEKEKNKSKKSPIY